jgi:hypothetical protein
MDLFEKSIDLDQDVFRNIVSLRESVDLFDDLTDGDESLSEVAIEAEMRVKKDLYPAQPGLIYRGFHYNTAIGYPFETEPYMATRYGDGTFGVWYGALDLETTLYETVYHMLRVELAVEGISDVIIRERAVYKIHCCAILLDLCGKEIDYPQLVSNDYEFTHTIGKRLQREGHPGLLAPSARCGGKNIVVFNPSVLSDPINHCFLTYSFNPDKMEVKIEREEGKVLKNIQASALGI